jgi:gliding motility-associated-like protein
VVDANGCTFGPQTIIVNVRPALIAVGSSSTICDTKTLTLKPTIVSPGNGGTYSYNWSNATTGPVATVTANYAANPNTYTVVIDDGCSIPNTTAVFTVYVNPTPNATYTPAYSEGCAPLTVQFNGIGDSTTTNPNPFFWTFSGGSAPASAALNPQNITFADPGTYSLTLTVTNKYGCQQFMTDPIAAVAYPVPVAAFVTTPSSVNLMDPTINFTNASNNANAYVWDFGDHSFPNTNTSFAVNPTHIYTSVGQYQIYMVAINSFGCKDTATAIIDVTPDMGVYIPNAFTPDKNGRNDVFMPYGYGISEDNYKMEIFDRWGELIFTSSDFRKGWDGSVKESDINSDKGTAQDGVYIYKIQITDLENNKKLYVGHVTLLKQ